MVFVISLAIESKLLKSRIQMQRKYLDQFYVLYDDFNITKLPLLPEEVCLIPFLHFNSHLYAIKFLWEILINVSSKALA